MLEHLNQLGTPTTCPVIMFIRNDSIMIGLRNYKKDSGEVTSVWTSPGGRCDAGESIEEALRREIAEEVGIHDITITHFLGSVDGAYPGDQVYVYLGITDQEPVLMEPEKFSEWAWCPIESLPANLNNQKTFDLVRTFYKNHNVH